MTLREATHLSMEAEEPQEASYGSDNTKQSPMSDCDLRSERVAPLTVYGQTRQPIGKRLRDGFAMLRDADDR